MMSDKQKDLQEDIKEVCYNICSQIYIARNITLDNDQIIKQLERIDNLLRDRSEEGYNYN
jgi:hypothetical protein